MAVTGCEWVRACTMNYEELLCLSRALSLSHLLSHAPHEPTNPSLTTNFPSRNQLELVKLTERGGSRGRQRRSSRGNIPGTRPRTDRRAESKAARDASTRGLNWSLVSASEAGGHVTVGGCPANKCYEEEAGWEGRRRGGRKNVRRTHAQFLGVQKYLAAHSNSPVHPKKDLSLSFSFVSARLSTFSTVRRPLKRSRVCVSLNFFARHDVPHEDSPCAGSGCALCPYQLGPHDHRGLGFDRPCTKPRLRLPIPQLWVQLQRRSWWQQQRKLGCSSERYC